MRSRGHKRPARSLERAKEGMAEPWPIAEGGICAKQDFEVELPTRWSEENQTLSVDFRE
jgi:hypothetical protein